MDFWNKSKQMQFITDSYAHIFKMFNGFLRMFIFVSVDVQQKEKLFYFSLVFKFVNELN